MFTTVLGSNLFTYNSSHLYTTHVRYFEREREKERVQGNVMILEIMVGLPNHFCFLRCMFSSILLEHNQENGIVCLALLKSNGCYDTYAVYYSGGTVLLTHSS